jgi:ZIP family zinc transporter
VANYLTNLPAAIGSSPAKRPAGTRPRALRRPWLLVAPHRASATVAGYAIAD